MVTRGLLGVGLVPPKVKYFPGIISVGVVSGLPGEMFVVRLSQSLQSWYLVSSIFVQAEDYPMSGTKPTSPARRLLFFPLLSSHDEYDPLIVDGLSVFTLHNQSVEDLFIFHINLTQTDRSAGKIVR